MPLWPGVKELTLGYRHERALIGSQYPVLRSLHLRSLRMVYNFATDTVDSVKAEWKTLGQSLQNVPPSLAELVIRVELLPWPQNAARDPHDCVPKFLRAAQWSSLASAIDAHMHLQSVQVIIELSPQLFCPLDPEVEEAANTIILPALFQSAHVLEVMRFRVRMGKEL